MPKNRTEREKVMSRLLLLTLAAILPLALAACDIDEPQTGEEMPLLMPMIDGQWHRQGRVFVMELAHGWLVRQPYAGAGNGNGLCFVPKPSTIQQ
jgi:hypothetical protein